MDGEEKTRRLEAKVKRLEEECRRRISMAAEAQSELTKARAGVRETSQLVDAVLCAVTRRCGRKIVADDDPTALAGWQLWLPDIDVKMLDKYQVMVRRNPGGDPAVPQGGYIVGVWRKPPAPEASGEVTGGGPAHRG